MLENEFLVATAKVFKEIKIHYKLVVLPHNKCQESLCVNPMWNRQGQFPLYLWNDLFEHAEHRLNLLQPSRTLQLSLFHTIGMQSKGTHDA